jgi:hydroxyacylglutathione hydrolase
MLVFDDGRIRVHKLSLGPLKTNCYLIQRGKLEFVIDPSGDPEVLLKYITEEGIKPSALILTHGHFDHFGAAAALEERFGSLEVFVPELDIPTLKKANSFSILIAKKSIKVPANLRSIDAQGSQIEQFGLKMTATPGHTPGSVVYFDPASQVLFTGDTILHHKIAIHALPFFEDRTVLQRSLALIRREFPKDALIFPGHGKLSRLEVELRYNKKVATLLEEVSE